MSAITGPEGSLINQGQSSYVSARVDGNHAGFAIIPDSNTYTSNQSGILANVSILTNKLGDTQLSNYTYSFANGSFTTGELKYNYINGKGSTLYIGEETLSGASGTVEQTNIDTNTNVTGNTTMTGTLSVNDNVTLAGSTLSVNNNTFINGTTHITGATTLHNTLSVNDNVTLAGTTLSVNNNTFINGTTHITGATTLHNTLSVNDNVTLAGTTLSVNNNTFINGTTHITGATTLHNTLSNDNVTLAGTTLSVNNNTFINGTAHITGATVFQNGFRCGQGGFQCDAATGNSQFEGTAKIGTELSVNDNTYIMGATHITGATTMSSNSKCCW